MKKIFIILFGLFILSEPVFAVTAIKGLATVRLVSRNMNVELEQATIIEGDKAFFQGLNDLGGEVFEAVFEPGAVYFSVGGATLGSTRPSLKKVLSLPLTRDEFLAILKHERPESFEDSCDCGHEAVWQHKKYPKLLVNFDQMAPINQLKEFPRHVHIEYKKNVFDLQWLTLETK